MANKIVAVPGIGNVSFPDGMSDGEINSAIEQQLGQNKPKNYSSMSPQDLASEAMKNSGVTGTQRLSPTAPQVNMQQQPTMAGAYANSVADNVSHAKNIYSAFGQDAGQLVSPRTFAGPVISGGVDALTSKLQPQATSSTDAVAGAAGINAPAIADAATNRQYDKLAGHSLLPLMTAFLGGKVASESGVSAGDLNPFPSRVRAGKNFQTAAAQAGDSPVNTSPAMEPALRMKELNDAGSYLPPVVKKFIKRITDPEQGPLTYSEARDFYSNAGDLSVTQRLKTNRKVGSQLNDFIDKLGSSIQDTADQAGVGQEHAAAMKEFAQSMRLKGVREDVIKQVLKPYLKALPYGAGAASGGAVVYGTYKALK